MNKYLKKEYKKNRKLRINHSYLVEQFSDYSKIIKGIEKRLIIMALRLNCISTNSDSINNKTKKIVASNIVTLFITKGLWDVRSTSLSSLISTKSLIIQPALRIKKDPTRKKIYHFKLSNRGKGREAKANQQGHINNAKPIGLSKRIKLSKDLISLWIELGDIL